MKKMLRMNYSTVTIYKAGSGYVVQIDLPTGDSLELPVQEFAQIKQVKDVLKLRMLTIKKGK